MMRVSRLMKMRLRESEGMEEDEAAGEGVLSRDGNKIHTYL